MHRNGIRPAGFSNLDALMKRLGAAAVIVDLAGVRHQTAATLVRNGLGSSKGLPTSSTTRRAWRHCCARSRTRSRPVCMTHCRR